MKILYISPENTVGTLTLWKKEHELRGHKCQTVSFFNSPKKLDTDICLNLPFNFTNNNMSKLRNMFYMYYRGLDGYFKEKKGFPPIWEPEGFLDLYFLKFKDWLWKPIVQKAIIEHNLYDFDVFHFESGMDFLKNEFFVQEIKKRGKKIICHYHGEDLRSRGVMPYIDSLSDLNLTNELDLMNKHPNIKYIFLPYKMSTFQDKGFLNKVLRVGHAPTNRYYKGSKYIIPICEKLHSVGEIYFDLIENVSHETALERKSKCDIFIDQVGNKGGWGYGMNSVEALSMGICTLTEMNDEYNSFIPDHPFIHITKDTIYQTIQSLITNPKKLLKYKNQAKKWVDKTHNIKKVADELYNHYQQLGLPC